MTLPRLTVLVTGSAGFIGRALCAALEAEHFRVIPYDLCDGKDVLDLKALRAIASDVDAVFHLAAASTRLLFEEDPRTSWLTTVQGTQNILDAFCGRVIVPSSGTVYGDSPKPAAESQHIPPPSNLYAAAKLECERLCFLYNLKGKDVKVLRIFTGYGPGESTKGRYASPIFGFLRDLTLGLTPEVFGDGNQMRDFVHVSDIVAALLSALNTTSPESLFNVGTGTATSMLAAVQAVAAALGSTQSPVFAPPPRGYVSAIVADPALASSALQFRTTVSLSRGLALTVEALKQDGDASPWALGGNTK